ncbi:hypothetical protein SAMN02910298_02341 [Pseudobutyrivibrio sp. YE44]|uniref:hypothetical protein n=1 Tax=Pseudobutyrivibrio sp. YE44 TaxID=1520802 RepID=UPI00087E0EBF|nr:hypothetical protein [Pseudobutyrivibrio sp. YE44]SDB46700.1 hypothetical protein SAMN02910298_02341 [Pseudobutyrivibrio sp. YE44]
MKNRLFIIKKSAVCLLTAVCAFTNVSLIANATEETEPTEEVATATESTEATEAPSPVAEASSSAIVEIEGYTIEGGMLDSGKEITVKLNLHNTGSSTAATSLMLTFSSASGMAYPTYGNDNQIYVGTIGAGQNKEVEVPLSISSQFVGDAIDLTCKFNYLAGGQSMNNEASLIIPKSGGSTIGVKSLSVSSHAIVNGKSLLSIGYVNQSGSNISDAKLVVDGNVSSSSKSIKLDTIYSGKSYNEDFYLTFKESGEQDVSVALVYTDVSGEEVHTDLGTFGVSVSKETEAEAEDNAVMNILAIVGKIVSLVGVVFVGALLVLYIKKR